MFAKIGYTWQIMGASWKVLRRDPRLLIFPLLSGICCILVMLSFILPVWDTHILSIRHFNTGGPDQVLRYAYLFFFYFCNYFVITFFNTGIIACAVSRMAGGEPTISGGFSEALKRIHLILGWTLISATIGLVIRIVEERSHLVGRIIAGIVGGVWSITTFLVVPILVVEEKGPFQALKASAGLFRKTWGERLVGGFSFGALFFALAIPAWIGIASGAYVISVSHALPLGLILIGFAIFYLMVLALIQSALQSIFQAAVYMYTQGVTADPQTTSGQGFPVELLRGAMYAK